MKTLTDGQLEAIGIVIEECGELLQSLGKTIRFGLDSRDPERPLSSTNRQDIERESGDVTFSLFLLSKLGVIDTTAFKERAKTKRRLIFKWLVTEELKNLWLKPPEPEIDTKGL